LNKKDIHLKKVRRPKRPKKLPKLISDDSLNKINSIANLKHKAILLLTYGTGMRISEVVNVKLSDINKVQNNENSSSTILIRNSKGNKDRYVPVSHALARILNNYVKMYRPKGYLFNGQASPSYSTSSCSKIVKKYIGANYTFHQLRHTYATKALDAGNDIHSVADQLGHSSIKTTEIYLHMTENRLLNRKHIT